MSLMTVAEAAERLGVSARQVQNLVARDELLQPVRGIIDRASVERRLAVRGGAHVRGWSEATAWGAVSLLSGGRAEWIGETQRSRLRARLRDIGPAELVERARCRAEVTRYRAHSSAGRYLHEILTNFDTADAAHRLGLVAVDKIDGYLEVADLAAVVRTHGLARDDHGRVTLRATSTPIGRLEDLARSSDVLLALDLAESFDPRERRAGLTVLDRALEDLRA